MTISAPIRLLTIALALLPAMATATTTSYRIPVKAKGSCTPYRVQRHGKWGFMNRAGQIVILPRFEDANDFFDGLAVVRLDNKLGYINEAGSLVVQPQFDSAEDFASGLASVTEGIRTGLVDRSGKFLINPQFVTIGKFSDGVATLWAGVKRQVNNNVQWIYSGHWGVVDQSGQIAVEPRFDWMQDFSEGLAAVRFGGGETLRVMSRRSTAPSGATRTPKALS